MEESTVAFFWVAITLPFLLLLQRWIHRHLRGVAYLLTGNKRWAVIIYAIILFPGVALHELSHWLSARLLGVRTGSISLMPRTLKDGSLQLGYVEYYKGRTLDPIRESIVGGAPLIVGTSALLLIGLHVFNVEIVGKALQTGEVDRLARALGQLFTTPDFFVWLYLIFAISNAMMPSPSDRRAWPAFLLLLLLCALILYLLEIQDLVLAGLSGPVVALFGYLGLAFSLAIGVDLLVILIIYTFERLVSRLRGVELVYGAVEPGPD